VSCAILAYLENVRLERTKVLHQNFVSIRKKIYRETFEMINVAFGGYTAESINVFEWFSK
jgi:hypothetical protein